MPKNYMTYQQIESTLKTTLNKIAKNNIGRQLKPGKYKKTLKGYIGRRLNGTYCSAFTLQEIKQKIKAQK